MPFGAGAFQHHPIWKSNYTVHSQKPKALVKIIFSSHFSYTVSFFLCVYIITSGLFGPVRPYVQRLTVLAIAANSD